MTRYALLPLPSANRVYRATAPGLAAAELRILSAGPLGGRVTDVARAELAGVPSLTFATAGHRPLDHGDLAVLGHLSVFVALRADLVALLAASGLRPLDDGPYRDLEHRVDQAIVRDVVVGRSPQS